MNYKILDDNRIKSFFLNNLVENTVKKMARSYFFYNGVNS